MPYEQMDDLGCFSTYFLVQHPCLSILWGGGPDFDGKLVGKEIIYYTVCPIVLWHMFLLVSFFGRPYICGFLFGILWVDFPVTTAATNNKQRVPRSCRFDCPRSRDPGPSVPVSTIFIPFHSDMSSY